MLFCNHILKDFPQLLLNLYIVNKKILQREGKSLHAIKQLSLTDIYSNLDEYFDKDKPKLINLFQENIDLEQLIPQSFFNHYYAATGHPREYSLVSMICALILKSILSITDTTLLLNILNLSNELREFCGFGNKVPDASQFSRFKINFEKDLENFFHSLVEITQPICQEINSELSNILINDTTGIEAYVKENNPKLFDNLFRQAKKLEKADPTFNAHSFTCSRMPKQSYANDDIKLSYINGHYCYALRVSVLTNGLGIIQGFDFADEPDIDISNADTASEAKDEYDAKSLIPTLKSFFTLHDFKYKYFIGDAGFDAVDNYKYLVKEHSMIPIIPLRRVPSLPKPGFNELGIPTCPKDNSLTMKFDGITREKGRADRIKWLCPKSKKARINGKTTYTLSCDNPCTESRCGRVCQIPINNDYRMNTAVPRNSDLWTTLYKIRTIIERANFMVKYPMTLNYTKLSNTKSLKSEFIISAITQQIVLLISNAINKTEHILSIKKLIA